VLYCIGAHSGAGDFPLRLVPATREEQMAESVYKVIELIGTSTDSWEKAASAAIERAAETLRDLRVAEVVQQDVVISEDGKVESYRVKMKLSFKYEAND
jgi:flavin-binding protein dodecin